MSHKMEHPNGATRSERIQVLERAIELEVDKSDFHFKSATEETIWDELESEFRERCARIGPSWIAA